MICRDDQDHDPAPTPAPGLGDGGRAGPGIGFPWELIYSTDGEALRRPRTQGSGWGPGIFILCTGTVITTNNPLLFRIDQQEKQSVVEVPDVLSVRPATSMM